MLTYRAEVLVLECWFLYHSTEGQVIVFLLTWSYGDGGHASQLQRDGGVHRRGWPSLFWDTGLQDRQPQEQLDHCRSSVDVAGFWRVVGNFNSLKTVGRVVGNFQQLSSWLLILIVKPKIPQIQSSGSIWSFLCGGWKCRDLWISAQGDGDRERQILPLKIFVVKL